MPLSAAIRKSVQVIAGEIRGSSSLPGGDINELYRLKTVKGDFVVKTHPNPPAGFFASEATGLAALKGAGLDVPEILLASEDFLLMECLSLGEAKPVKAGEQLAALHSFAVPEYGFKQSTFLATLLQDNHATQSAADFFFTRRLKPMLVLFNHDTGREAESWQKFAAKTSALLNSCPQPSLLHGDLWAGNLYHAARGPVFIDPACYQADALIDIAMAQLFGGFGDRFYAAYWGNMPERKHRDELIQIYQVYPLLVHAHLFGGGYYRSACRIRDNF